MRFFPSTSFNCNWCAWRGLSLRQRCRDLRMDSSNAAHKTLRTRIVAVGDVHGQWDEQDYKALECLDPGAAPHACRCFTLCERLLVG